MIGAKEQCRGIARGEERHHKRRVLPPNAKHTVLTPTPRIENHTAHAAGLVKGLVDGVGRGGEQGWRGVGRGRTERAAVVGMRGSALSATDSACQLAAASLSTADVPINCSKATSQQMGEDCLVERGLVSTLGVRLLLHVRVDGLA